MTISKQFTEAVEAYLTESEMLPTTFGKQAMNDPGFVFQLRDGRACSAKTMDRVLAWIEENPPKRLRAAS